MVRAVGVRMTHTTTTRDKRGVYHCAGDTWGKWAGCLDMRVHGDLAETEIARQFLERCAFSILTASGARAGSPRTLWAEASLAERQRLLRLVIERIVVTPSRVTIPRTQYRKLLRHDLRIGWKTDVAERDDIVVIADEPVVPGRRVVSESRHQMLRASEHRKIEAPSPDPQALPEMGELTWAQWRRELAARQAP